MLFNARVWVSHGMALHGVSLKWRILSLHLEVPFVFSRVETYGWDVFPYGHLLSIFSKSYFAKDLSETPRYEKSFLFRRFDFQTSGRSQCLVLLSSCHFFPWFVLPIFMCGSLPFTHCSSPSSHPHDTASLSCSALQPSEGETAKSPKHQDSPTVVPIWWLRRLGDFAVSHMLLHTCPWIDTMSFPSQCFCFCSTWLQKERRYSCSCL